MTLRGRKAQSFSPLKQIKEEIKTFLSKQLLKNPTPKVKHRLVALLFSSSSLKQTQTTLFIKLNEIKTLFSILNPVEDLVAEAAGSD